MKELFVCSWQPASVVVHFIVNPASAFPQVSHSLFTPNFTTREKKLAAKAACSRNPPKNQHCKYCTQKLIECMYTMHAHKTYIYLPVWLLCACVREARQRESSRPHTPTPQMQGPRSRILSERNKNTVCKREHVI